MAALLPCAPSSSTTASFCFRRPSLWPLQDLPSLRPPPSFPAPPLRFATARRTPLLAASSNRSQATQQQQEEEEEENSIAAIVEQLDRVHSGAKVIKKYLMPFSSFAACLNDSDDVFGKNAVGEGVVPAPPPTPGRIDIVVTKDVIRRLDLSPAHDILRKYVHQIGDNTSTPAEEPHDLLERTVGFVLEYENDDPLDPRELSELPDIRLWFVRLDAAYPWLPIVVDWRAGELSRYAAMLVPHQMSKRLGLVYNPEALELFAMNKLFLIHEWLKARNVSKPHVKLNNMMRMLGFSISNELYDLIDKNPHP